MGLRVIPRQPHLEALAMRKPTSPNAFPWESPEAEAAFRKWEEAYSTHDTQYKVCDLLRTFGSPADIAILKSIVDIHDRGTRVDARAELA